MMNNSKCNQSIKCTVSQCQYHNPSENYCSLDCVAIGTHESNPTQKQCVDCESFALKSGCSCK